MKVYDRITQLEIIMAGKGKMSFDPLTPEERQLFIILNNERHYQNIRGEPDDYESAEFKEWRYLSHKIFKNRRIKKIGCVGIADALKEARLVRKEEQRLYRNAIGRGETPDTEQIIAHAKETIERRLCNNESKK